MQDGSKKRRIEIVLMKSEIIETVLKDAISRFLRICWISLSRRRVYLPVRSRHALKCWRQGIESG